ncbi:MAG: hypothetical protein WD738_02940 [Pirellulales bacterium]
MITVYAISLLLVGLSGLMLDLHRRSWRAAQHDRTVSERDLRFARSQYRRRNQASGIIGVLGAAVGVGPLVPPRPWPMVLYVASLAGACACIILLAGLDAWATRQNFARLRSEQLAAQVKLARELSRDTKSRTDNPVRQ